MEADGEGELDACHNRRVEFHCGAPSVCVRRKIKMAKPTNSKSPIIASDKPKTPMMVLKKATPSSVMTSIPTARHPEIGVLLTSSVPFKCRNWLLHQVLSSTRTENDKAALSESSAGRQFSF
jgi:hypothetical protein